MLVKADRDDTEYKQSGREPKETVSRGTGPAPGRHSSSVRTEREDPTSGRNGTAKAENRRAFEGLVGKRNRRQTHCELSGLGVGLGVLQRWLGKLRKV